MYHHFGIFYTPVPPSYRTTVFLHFTYNKCFFFLRHRKRIFNAPVPTRFDNIGVFLLFRYHKYILMHQYLPGFIHQVYSCILDTYICYICRECTFDAPVPRFDTPGVSLYFRYQKCKNMFKCIVRDLSLYFRPQMYS